MAVGLIGASGVGNVGDRADTIASDSFPSIEAVLGMNIVGAEYRRQQVAQGAARQVRVVESTRQAVREAARPAESSAQTASATSGAACGARRRGGG